MSGKIDSSSPTNIESDHGASASEVEESVVEFEYEDIDTYVDGNKAGPSFVELSADLSAGTLYQGNDVDLSFKDNPPNMPSNESSLMSTSSVHGPRRVTRRSAKDNLNSVPEADSAPSKCFFCGKGASLQEYLRPCNDKIYKNILYNLNVRKNVGKRLLDKYPHLENVVLEDKLNKNYPLLYHSQCNSQFVTKPHHKEKYEKLIQEKANENINVAAVPEVHQNEDELPELQEHQEPMEARDDPAPQRIDDSEKCLFCSKKAKKFKGQKYYLGTCKSVSTLLHLQEYAVYLGDKDFALKIQLLINDNILPQYHKHCYAFFATKYHNKKNRVDTASEMNNTRAVFKKAFKEMFLLIQNDIVANKRCLRLKFLLDLYRKAIYKYCDKINLSRPKYIPSESLEKKIKTNCSNMVSINEVTLHNKQCKVVMPLNFQVPTNFEEIKMLEDNEIQFNTAAILREEC